MQKSQTDYQRRMRANDLTFGRGVIGGHILGAITLLKDAIENLEEMQHSGIAIGSTYSYDKMKDAVTYIADVGVDLAEADTADFVKLEGEAQQTIDAESEVHGNA